MPDCDLISEENLGHKVPALRRAAPRSLVALANLYLRTQVMGQSPHTVDAKRRDLERLLRFYVDLYGHDDPAEWYPSVTRELVSRLQRDRQASTGRPLSPASVARVYATVRHFARWAHRNAFEFPQGSPVEGIRPPEEPEGEFKGLERKDVVRLLAAADSLQHAQSRGTNQGVRNRAILHCLLASALRVSEVIGLELNQYDGRALRDVHQKGGRRRRAVPLNAAAREAMDAYLRERGREAGPLFLTRTGIRLDRRQIYEIVKRMERQANAHLPRMQRLEATPHILRHTRLRRVAEERGVQVAQKLSGHRSGRYIWRYVQPSDRDLEALDTLD